MMITYLSRVGVLLVLLAFSCCGSPEQDPGKAQSTPTPTPTSSAPAPAPKKPTPYEQEKQLLDAIRADYATVQEAIRTGRMRKDSFPYECTEAMLDGQVNIYEGIEDLRLVIHTFSPGDHDGITEEYYFRGDELIFLFVETGSWKFGGPLETLEDGTEVPGTIDEITEERRYFNADTLLKALTKSYVLNSWEDTENVAQSTPNRVEADPYRSQAGVAMIRSVLRDRRVDCEQVLYMF